VDGCLAASATSLPSSTQPAASSAKLEDRILRLSMLALEAKRVVPFSVGGVAHHMIGIHVSFPSFFLTHVGYQVPTSILVSSFTSLIGDTNTKLTDWTFFSVLFLCTLNDGLGNSSSPDSSSVSGMTSFVLKTWLSGAVPSLSSGSVNLPSSPGSAPFFECSL
jgi:hypothetical protein